MRKKSFGVERVGRKNVRSDVDQDRSRSEAPAGANRLPGAADPTVRAASAGSKSLMKTSALATRQLLQAAPGVAPACGSGSKAPHRKPHTGLCRAPAEDRRTRRSGERRAGQRH